MKYMGVYEIRNKANGKVYIGSSNDIKKRWYWHKWTLKKGNHHSRYLQRSFNKYGVNGFKFNIIELVENDNDLLTREQYHMDRLKPFINTNGYNMSDTAGRNVMKGEKHPRYGKTLSKEEREQMSLSVKKWYEENENPHIGSKRNEETKLKMSLAKKGKVFGENNNFYGKKHSSVSKEKMSKTSKGMYTGDKNPKAKLTENDVREIRKLWATGEITLKALGEKFNVSKSCVMYIVTNRSWKHVI